MMDFRAWGLSAFVVFLAVPANAQFSEVCGVPLAIAEPERQLLESRRHALVSRQISVIRDGERFNADCASVKKNSAQHSQCLSRHGQLVGRRDGLNGDVAAFCLRAWRHADEIMANWAVQAMIDRAMEDSDAYLRAAAKTGRPEVERTGMALAVLRAARGYFARARRLLGIAIDPDQPDDHLHKFDRQLDRRQLSVAEYQTRRPFALGGIDETVVNAANTEAQRLIWDASVLMGQGAYEESLNLFDRAAGTAKFAAGTQQAVRDAMTWTRQLKRQRDERLSIRDLSDHYRKRRERAAAEQAWQMAHAMALNGEREAASDFYTEAQSLLADRSGHPARIIADQHRAVKAGTSQVNPSLGNILVRPASRTEAVLDALEYGRGSWTRAQSYLRIRAALLPEDPILREASSYVSKLRHATK